MNGGQNRASRTSSGQRPGSDTGVGFWAFGFKKGQELGRRTVAFILVLVVVVWLVAAAYLILVSRAMVAARRVQGARDQLTALYKENAILEQQIAAQQAVEKLSWEAERAGFVPAARFEFVEP